MPKRLGARIKLARRLAKFFEQHPEYAVSFAHVTAAAGHALHAESTAATRAMRDTARDAGECKRLRDAAEKCLRRQMRGTVLMLSAVLDRSDPRWYKLQVCPRRSCSIRLRRATRGGVGFRNISELNGVTSRVVRRIR